MFFNFYGVEINPNDNTNSPATEGMKIKDKFGVLGVFENFDEHLIKFKILIYLVCSAI